MGYQTTDQDQSGAHSNNTAYVGNGVFGPLLRQLANQYGTQQAAADLIFGGKQYGKARTYLPDQYRDLTPSQGQSLNNAKAIEQQNREMPSYKGADGTIWTWDKKGQVYIGYQKDKGEYTKKVGAWSPWDKENTTPPWKTGGGDPADQKTGPGSQPSTAPQGDVNPQTGRPWGVSRRVPGVGRADEQGLTGLGVRTESPATQKIQDPGPKGQSPRTETETEEFGRRFGMTPTGMTATYDPQTGNPFDAGNPSSRDNWNTHYDPRPSTERLGKGPQSSDLASQHPATFAKDAAAEDTFAKLLAGLRR